METKIIYDNRTFIIDLRGRYYNATVKGKNVSLHRYVYEQYNGPIKKGFHVHHIDGDPHNNAPENLIAIAAKIHARLHPVSRERLDKWSAAGREAAKAWHGSADGLAWHRQHYADVEKRMQQKVERRCTQCGKKIKTKRKTANCFCCAYCKSKYRIQQGLDVVEKNCLACGAVFTAQKHNGAEYCSRQCRPKTGPKPKG